MRKKITISGTGCALADNLYTNIDFSTIEFKKYLSKTHADGGLSPGRLVFTEEFENFTGDKFENLLKEISGNKEPESFNIGGPSIVSLINASQLLFDYDVEIRFYGAIGKDDIGRKIQESLKSVKINFSNYKAFDSPSPFTDVFSDPNYDHGRGERIFVNNIGAAWEYTPKHLNDAFFKSDITVFGGTALVPNIHDNLTTLLSKAKRHGSFTIVNTVYDFRNEKKYPNKNWPLVEDGNSYELIDLLITDLEEALKISGTKNIDTALDYFKTKRVKNVIITQGPNPVYGFSADDAFKNSPLFKLPVSEAVSYELAKGNVNGDTTGCGDNFVGGVIASLAKQMSDGSVKLDLQKAVELGVASGGFACFYYGGVFSESTIGQKYKLVAYYLEKYQSQL